MSLDLSHQEVKIHFVGIGGIGMSGIAQVFLNQGFKVSGSDTHHSEMLERLQKLGAQIYLGHSPENIHEASVVVISSAISETNPEYLEARRRRIPVISRAEMLAELMRGKVGIAVAGSHGKTTTTSLLTAVLKEAELDPTAVIGGRVDAFGGSNSRLGKGRFVIAEADESDGSFLHLPTTFGIVTNIDNDHLDYFKHQDQIDALFLKFIAKLPFYGMAMVCGEDPGVRRCLEHFSKPFLTYGFSSEWDWFAQNIHLEARSSRFEVWKNHSPHHEPKPLGTIELGIPGEHQILNALAVIGIAHRLQISFDVIQKSLSQFRGVKRRFEIRWEDSKNKKIILDDYGHHPTEIRATLATAKRFWPKGRVISIFQPHRYSRTFHCWEDFLSSFEECDYLFVTPIYSAGEEAIPGIDSRRLVHDLTLKARPHQKIFYYETLEETAKKVLEIFSTGDLILCQGAGSITELPNKLIHSLESPMSL